MDATIPSVKRGSIGFSVTFSVLTCKQCRKSYKEKKLWPTCGKKCVMQNFDAPHELGAKVPELVGENGLPVVKLLTDDLIDELGPKILKEYFRT